MNLRYFLSYWSCEINVRVQLIRLWFRLLPCRVTTWWPLYLLKHFGLDIWYATRVLGWELDYDPGSKKQYRFRTKDKRVILPSDYLYRAPVF